LRIVDYSAEIFRDRYLSQQIKDCRTENLQPYLLILMS